MAQGQTGRAQRSARSRRTVRRPSLLVRILIALAIVVAVGAVSFLIGYVIGLQLGLLPLLA